MPVWEEELRSESMTPGEPPVDDSIHMRRALELAERGWGRVAPNPLVGAVLVRDGHTVGAGWHREYGEPHAEVEAIRAADGQARDATLYVTLEPCAHHGKTGPCTEAIIAAGIRRVVFAVSDPDPAAGGGADRLRAAGIDVLGGIEEDAARSLNRPFLRAHDPHGPARPWIELKLALSLDGRVADSTGRSNWITGASARAEVHRLRAGADAIAVGIGTALADDPILTARGAVTPRIPPIRVVFDRSLRLPLHGRLVRSARDIPVWIICAPNPPNESRDRLLARGARIIESTDLNDGVAALAADGIRSLFCEGGAHLASALLRNDLVDRLSLFYAPLFLGSDGADPFRDLTSRPLDQADRWTVLGTTAFGDDTLIRLDR
jgi:diaminohydroxyphosphoribosylaminopyrimidine deaminase / 5-amino-6-(5-phosphoribosylamino)uracil reductase